MKKPKLFAWCDFLVPTGFGVVAKNLLDDMHNYFDVSILGINYKGDTKYDTSKYFVYSVAENDLLGYKRILSIIDKEKPDIIFLFQDIFHINEVIKYIKKLEFNSKIVIYFPVDGQPFSKLWKPALDLADSIITYSKWAKKIILDAFPGFNKKINILYHGVDTNIFYPLNLNNIIEYKKKLNWQNKFIITNVNRFQPRKAIPLTLRIFNLFTKGYKKCSCGNLIPNHLNRCDLNNCSLDNVVYINNNIKNDVYLYLHMMPEEFSMGMGYTNSLQHHILNNGFTEEDYGIIIGINGKNIYNGEVPEEELNYIYNISNVNITTSLGEGCGLSLLESAATGTPSIAPNNSAIPEQLNGTGTLVNNKTVFSFPNDNAHIRPIVDIEGMVLALEKYYNEWKSQKEEKIIYNECIENIKNNFLWDDKKQFLLNIFKKTLEQK
ncbi:MAG: glycosyltransferase family 4 protein [Spirochaetes bacterium]|nr:glycosyltransferase family 4 protein [Spirochaetota bacterium]